MNIELCEYKVNETALDGRQVKIKIIVTFPRSKKNNLNDAVVDLFKTLGIASDGDEIPFFGLKELAREPIARASWGQDDLHTPDSAKVEEPASPAKPRRGKAVTAKVEEPASPARPRRGKAVTAKVEEPASPAKPRRGKAVTAKVEEPASPAKPRRGKAVTAKVEEPRFTAEDVLRAASDAAAELGPTLTQSIVARYSESGKITDIPEEDRQAFIDDVNYNLEV